VTAGAVLCGGASRRMGTDKAFVEVDGVAMAERVATALVEGGCEPVVFVGGDAGLLARFDRPTLEDRWPGEGPVNAILTALTALSDDVVIAACDLPFLDGPTVRALIDAGSAGDGPDAAVDVVVATAAAGRLQLLVSWWSRRARPAVEREWLAGRRAAGEVVAALTSRTVVVSAAALRNVNRPGDLD